MKYFDNHIISRCSLCYLREFFIYFEIFSLSSSSLRGKAEPKEGF